MASTGLDSEWDEPRPRRRWPWVLFALLVAFAGGLAAMGYGVTHSPRLAAAIHLVPQQQADADVAIAKQTIVREMPKPNTPPSAAATPGTPDPALAGRLAALTSQVAAIEAQARAATGDASRAEGLLVAFAARRALDRGIPLGYIEGLLRDRFGHGQPEAVATVLSAARQPVTLADLQTGLDTVAPTLAAQGDSPQESWWQSFRRELTGMVVIRRAGEPSTIPADRVGRAERMLEAGQVDGAVAEIMRLPNHVVADPWIAAARRYLAGRGALDRIETAALLEPSPPDAPMQPWPGAASAGPAAAAPPTASPGAGAGAPPAH